MTSPNVVLRKAAFTAIGNAVGSYIITDVDIEETYFPKENLEALGEKPFIKVIAIGFSADRDRTLRDTTKVLLTVPVQIAVQQRVTLKDTDYIDRLVELAEQIMATLEDDELVANQDFQWLRTEPLKDENGLIYSYQDLSEKGVFMSIFTSHYHHIRQP